MDTDKPMNENKSSKLSALTPFASLVLALFMVASCVRGCALSRQVEVLDHDIVPMLVLLILRPHRPRRRPRSPQLLRRVLCLTCM